MIRLIIAIVTTVLAGSVFFFYTQPAYDLVRTDQAQIDQYNQALDKAAQLQQLKQSLLARYNAFDPNNLDHLQKLLPDHVDNIGLILELDNLAGHYGLALQNVDVSTPGTQTPAAKTAVGSVGVANQTYSSLTLTFSTQGAYDSFVQFMNDLQSSLRVVDIVSLTVSPVGTTNAAGRPGVPAQPVYTYQITLRTYWLK
jgi:Tfp pilus assembly protein PilO